MPVSGLVITFSGDVTDHRMSLKRLHEEPAIEVGEARGAKLAIVVDTESRQRDQEIWQWVCELPGVILVDVAFVGFEEPESHSELASQ